MIPVVVAAIVLGGAALFAPVLAEALTGSTPPVLTVVSGAGGAVAATAAALAIWMFPIIRAERDAVKRYPDAIVFIAQRSVDLVHGLWGLVGQPTDVRLPSSFIVIVSSHGVSFEPPQRVEDSIQIAREQVVRVIPTHVAIPRPFPGIAFIVASSSGAELALSFVPCATGSPRPRSAAETARLLRQITRALDR